MKELKMNRLTHYRRILMGVLKGGLASRATLQEVARLFKKCEMDPTSQCESRRAQ